MNCPSINLRSLTIFEQPFDIRLLAVLQCSENFACLRGSGDQGIRELTGVRGSEETNTEDRSCGARGSSRHGRRLRSTARIAEPTTTSVDAAGRIVRIFIEAPLEDVATHIIQPIAIRFLLTYTMCLISTIFSYQPTSSKSLLPA